MKVRGHVICKDAVHYAVGVERAIEGAGAATIPRGLVHCRAWLQGCARAFDKGQGLEARGPSRGGCAVSG